MQRWSELDTSLPSSAVGYWIMHAQYFDLRYFNLYQFLPPSYSSCSYLLRGFCQKAVRRRMWQINFYHLDPMSKSLIQILISSPKCIWELGSLSPEIISLPKPSPDTGTKRCRAGSRRLLDDDNFAGLVIFSPRPGSRHQTGARSWRGEWQDKIWHRLTSRQVRRPRSSGQLHKQIDGKLIWRTLGRNQ